MGIHTLIDSGMPWDTWVQKVIDDTGYDKPEFRTWLKSKEYLAQNYFSSIHYLRCYLIARSIKKKKGDHFIVIEGKEGMGKSTLAAQTAAVIDPNFGKSKICYAPLKFLRGLKASIRGDAFQLDEGNLFLFSRNAMTEGNKDMVVLFALMRQKGACVIICVPNFFTLDSYVREHRVGTLIHIRNRGSFQVITHQKSIRIISKEGMKKSKSVSAVKIPYGTFYDASNNKQFPVLPDLNEDIYEEDKAETFGEFLEELEQRAMMKDQQSEWVPVAEVTKHIPVSKSTVHRLIKKKEITAKRFGQKYFILRSDLDKIE